MSVYPHSRFGRFKLAVAAAALVGLSACTQNFNADVSRFAAQLPAPSGQTFAVVADDPMMAGGIEFSGYADLVEAKLAQQGYAMVDNPEQAQLLVRFDYGVDKGRDRVVRSPGMYRDPFYSPWYGYGRAGSWGGYYGNPYRQHYGAWGYGWHDPFFNQGGYESYTVYTSGIEVKIDNRADGRRLFEGKAEAVSTSNRLPYLVPNLVEAMFSGFPGNTGETVRISVAPEKKRN